MMTICSWVGLSGAEMKDELLIEPMDFRASWFVAERRWEASSTFVTRTFWLRWSSSIAAKGY